MRHSLIFYIPLMLIFSACSGSTTPTITDGADASNFPDIATFASSPSDQFFLNDTGSEKVSRVSPYNGADTACAHTGAHVQFTNDASPYTIPLYAPVTGTIDRVDTCFIVGDNDRYGITIAFATFGDVDIGFDFSIEPMGGHLCSGGVEGVDNGAFDAYILVTEGQEVTKGDLIAYMYKPNTGQDDSHIHFDLSPTSGDNFFACPNIFNAEITTQFWDHLGDSQCSDTPYPTATFCYLPGDGEDLVNSP